MTMQGGAGLLDALGDIPEYGSGPRIVLPEGLYVMDIEVGEQTTTDQGDDIMTDKVWSKGQIVDEVPVEDVNGSEVLVGGTPYVELTTTPAEGPFEECGFQSRFYLTPGKGRNIGFVNHACKAITGKPVDVKVLGEFGFDFEGLSEQSEIQTRFRACYLALTPEQRLDLMVRYARVVQWDGKTAVVKVGVEERERTDEATGAKYMVPFNRVQGFHAIDDPKRGAGYVRKVQHPKQTAYAIEAGLIDAGDATTTA